MRIIGIIIFVLSAFSGVFAQQQENTPKKADQVQPADKKNQQTAVKNSTEQKQRMDYSKAVPSKTYAKPAGAVEVKREPVPLDPNKVVKSNTEVK